MKIIYTVAFFFVRGILPLVGCFIGKIARMLAGQKRSFDVLKNINHNDKILWVHCASLGEFEQGLPFIKNFLKQATDYKLLLSFFSPSGYEVQKNNPLANWVVYLPMDSPQNAVRFITLAKPNIAVFVKYDFWYHYLNTLQKNNIPTFLIAAIFRPNQWFFKGYGKFGLRMLRCFTHIFVQDTPSEKLLQKYIPNHQVGVAGDTRFERVLEITKTPLKNDDWLINFKAGKKMLVMGSTWETEENQILQIIDEVLLKGYQILIAPHEITPSKIAFLTKKLTQKNISHARYSQKNHPLPKDIQVFILDAYGLLSAVYGYATIAYVGGGYTKDGIHNVLEPAAFGKPIIIGRNYQKFKEARDLVSLGGVLVTHCAESFLQTLTKLTAPLYQKKTGNICRGYVEKHQYASATILKTIVKKMTL